MAIPDFESCMLPLLEHLRDGKEPSTRETLDALAGRFRLADDERREPLPSGNQPLFTNRVAWAKFYLKKALLLTNPRRGVHRITDRGLQLLTSSPTPINIQALQQHPEFREFLLRSRTSDGLSAGALAPTVAPLSLPRTDPAVPELTPEEYIELGYSRLRGELQTELLTRIKEAHDFRVLK